MSSRAYYLEHREEILKKCKEYNDNNREKRRLQQAEYRKKNKDKIKKCQQKYRDNNKQAAKEYKKQYYQENKQRINKRINDKRRDDPNTKFIHNLRHRVYTAFKNGYFFKNNKTKDLLGAPFEIVKEHIEHQFTEGMSWELVGPKIHIDHIIPLASAKSEKELIELFHYTNLQPLWAEDNLRKNSKVI